ncbi:MAG: phenylacetate--CoA ligase family protein [Planctomycetota bacterium]|nr:MAG: phenylacetate--CoA ligase family protein [Planctomycetota bacterium]REK30297.1 MAG: phenylacetate--CoA ligase family protein [Planctomycetota bacterium]
MDADQLAAHQLERLNNLLATILPANRFYADKLRDVSVPLESLDQLAQLPYTLKAELAGGPNQSLANNHTWPRNAYVRWHQTSGTRGRPMVVMDTEEDWLWCVDAWQYVLDAAEVTKDDVCFLAFSFGPFIGFWFGFDAAAWRNCMVVPGGGMGTLSRIEMLRTSGATCLFCTPSYALHLAEVAAQHNIDVAALDVRCLILAGEPGASVPAIRQRLESTFAARVVDHSGATEVGPWGYGRSDGRGLHVIESEFIAEFFSVETGLPAAEGDLAELVLTTLGRHGAPVIRYRTGDLVRPTWQHDGENRFVLLEGGVLGRVDDMMIIRGVNIYPSSIEQILRSFPEVVEYRMTVFKEQEMDRLLIEVEDRLDNPQRLEEELRLRLSLKVAVQSVPLGSLPRYEAKGKRFVDQRGTVDASS